MTSATRKRLSCSESRKEEHLRFLEHLDNLPLADSCCEICHCDCYSSHRSWDLNEATEEDRADLFGDLDSAAGRQESTQPDTNNNHSKTVSGNKHPAPNKSTTTKRKKKHRDNAKPKEEHATCTKASPKRSSPAPVVQQFRKSRKRSKSASSMRSQQSGASIHNMRDCKILQELLTSLEDTPRLEVVGKSKKPPTVHLGGLKASWPHSLNFASASTSKLHGLAPVKLSESMANLCLSPSVRQAYHKVSTHDQRILNRMATKRSEHATAKENAWLARKYWENERYERELLKCEEMEEYKRAVRDKQFQDYLQTKARLNELAQRDMAELQRLRDSLQAKDERARRRLEAVRTERSIMQCQRRCDELRKSEAVNLQQEEHSLEDAVRKQEMCQRLTERLERADQIRNRMLESYLKRVRYENYIEQLLHEEKWREAQRLDAMKREQLKQDISQKRTRSQLFVEKRQRCNEATMKTAKISASLRELVRNSVTPDGALADGFSGAAPMSLGGLIFERPISKLSMQ